MNNRNIPSVPVEKRDDFESHGQNLLLKITEEKSEDRSFNDGEKEKLLDRVKDILAEVGKLLDLKGDDVLVCYIALKAGSEKEKNKQIEDIKEEERIKFVYIDDDLSSGRYRTKDEIDVAVKKELQKRKPIFVSEAYLDIKIADRKNPEGGSSRYTSNIRVYDDSYVTKWRGEVSFEELVKSIVSELKEKK